MRAGAGLAGALALGIALGAGCKKREDPAPAPANAVIGEAELKRGRDACAAYLAQACACGKSVPAAQEWCARDQALVESLQLALAVVAHPETERKDALLSAAALRKLIASCIEQTAKLPGLGCP